MDLNFYDPNAAMAAMLVSSEVRAIVEEIGDTAVMLVQAEVAKRTGRLAASARVQTEIGGVSGPRWVAHVTIGGAGAKGTVDYGAAEEFGHQQDEAGLIGGKSKTAGKSFIDVPGAHDLNIVLQQLGTI